MIVKYDFAVRGIETKVNIKVEKIDELKRIIR